MKRSPLLTGILTNWWLDRGYGFIICDEPGPPLFVHVTAISEDPNTIRIGDRLKFRVIKDKGKYRAVQVSR
jgi:cold shock CspA family protein